MKDTVCFYMGKAGSSTVVAACESLGIHCSRAYDKLEGPQADYRYIITLVRDPVARNLSAFFEEHVDGWVEKGQWPALERMAWHFLNWPTTEHNHPLGWFDSVLGMETGLDVYQCEWSPRKGWAVYDHGPRRILVIRTDVLTKKLGAAMAELYEDEALEPVVGHRAKGVDKFGHGLGEVYGEWLEMVRLPADYLDWMYSSDYARHFWFKAELQRLRERWQGP